MICIHFYEQFGSFDHAVKVPDTFYHHSIIATLWITPIIISALGTCYFIFGKAGNTKVGSFIRYCSVNLNMIYIIQWLIIAYSAAIRILLGFDKTSSPLVILLGGINVTAISILLSVLFVKKKRKTNIHQ